MLEKMEKLDYARLRTLCMHFPDAKDVQAFCCWRQCINKTRVRKIEPLLRASFAESEVPHRRLDLHLEWQRHATKHVRKENENCSRADTSILTGTTQMVNRILWKPTTRHTIYPQHLAELWLLLIADCWLSRLLWFCLMFYSFLLAGEVARRNCCRSLRTDMRRSPSKY